MKRGGIYMNHYFSSDKYLPECLPKHCIPRENLMTLINNSVGNGLVFLSAPAGYGKTTATNLWIKQMNFFNVWITLDAYDNSQTAFYRSFYSALQAIENKNLHSKNRAASIDFSNSPIDQTLKLIRGLTTKDFSIIVLDNFHVITNQAVRESFYTLQSSLPRNILVIILTRESVHSLEMERLCNRKCIVISEQNLAFSLEETTTFIQQFSFLLTAETITEIHEKTEGYGTVLKTLLLRDFSPTKPFSEEKLIEYFEKQILNQLSPAQQNFMLKTAVLDDLHPAICDALTEQMNSKDYLEELHRGNPFIKKIGKQIYQYHPIFKKFLYEMAEQKLDLHQLNLKASIYYLSYDENFKGIQHAIKANSENNILQSLLEFKRHYLHSLEKYWHFVQFLNANQLPESFLQKYPFLYIFCISYYYAIGNYSNLTHYADKLTHALPLIQKNFPSHIPFYFQGLMLDPRKSIDELLKAFSSLELAEQPTTTERQVALHPMEGQSPFFHRSIRNCVELCDPSMIKKIETIFQGRKNSDGLWILEGIRCGLHCELNEQAQALACADHLKKNFSSIKKPAVRFAVMIQTASAYFINNKPKNCNLILTQAKRYIEATGADHLYPNWIAYHTKLELWKGHKNAAIYWLQSEFSPDTSQLYLHKILYYFTTIRSYIVLEQYEDAIQLATLLHKLMEEFNRPLDSAEAMVLRAIAENLQGNTLHAQQLLIQVLQDLEADRFITIVAIEGAAVLPILKSIPLESISEKLDSTYFKAVLKAAANFAAYRPGLHSQKSRIKLSPRQQTILFLLSKGYSYKEMMAETNLTMHTIKAHVSALYQKLDVHDSASALVKARRIGLLP